MNSPTSSQSCGDCKSPLDSAHDPPDGRKPCPHCGSTKRAYHMVASNPVMSAYTLDNFIGHKLSQLTACGAEDLVDSPKWLNTFVLRTIFQLNLDPRVRTYLFSFLRRAEGACDAYRQARQHLIEYIETPRNTISPYFRALGQFEICISQSYQALELIASLMSQKIFESGSGAPEEKLQIVYVDSKHMDRMIHGGKLPETAPTGVWLTNSAIESARAVLSFGELHAILMQLHGLAEKLCNTNPPASAHVG